MAQQRLTEAVRAAILKNLIDTTFQPRETELKKTRAALGDACYHLTYPHHIQSAMYSLPNGFLPENETLFIQFGTAMDRLGFSEDETESRRIADRHDGQRAVALQLAEDHPLSVRYFELKAAEEKLKADKSSARSSARGVLKSVRSYEKLVELWPAVEPFAKPFRNQEAKATTFALSLPISDINSLLGLKP